MLRFTHRKKGKIPRCIIHQGIKIAYHFKSRLSIFNFLLSPLNENQYYFTRTVFIFDFPLSIFYSPGLLRSPATTFPEGCPEIATSLRNTASSYLCG
jgi:hypothetical protein